MSFNDVFIFRESKDNLANFRGKPPIVLPKEEFRTLIQAGKLRGAYLSELGRKQVYYVDVTREENPHMYHRPFVRADQ